ncbi:DUF1285 domain-containing protein [Hyphomicrobium sp. D-2]|uniref:DUF1285 domain-containing protein n=1 Tax=Hyphomicrobium sp. D-2 TaxID=3041621 RepID=UPI002455777E|nr:DUF1285 domain-containing protein [Hyphomicrobium sp. D-2]MDH4982672.1 DUF1285 domain-containing protein [Hyphomicrobium sp. D-2]
MHLGDIGKLQEVLKALPPGQRCAPVENWNPPFCGDIGLKILRDGTWLYQGSPIRRPELVNLFASVLRKDSDGRTYLVTPAEKIAIEVEDAPFLAVDMQVEGGGEAQRLSFRTNLDDQVVCGPSHPLRFIEEKGSGGLKPYLLVRGRLEALVTRSLVHDLAALAVEAPAGAVDAGEADAGEPNFGVWSEGAFFPFTPLT